MSVTLHVSRDVHYHIELELSAEDVVRRGAVKIQVNQTFRLADAAEALSLLESGQNIGKVVLVP